MSASRCRSPSACGAQRAAANGSTTILVVPITLGTVLIAEGLLTYLGPQGLGQPAADRAAVSTRRRSGSRTTTGACSLADHRRLPVRLPAHPLLRHRDRPGARARRGDARRGSAAAVPAHLPAAARARASRSPSASAFVQAFSVFPSAVLLGAPAGPTRVISIAATQAAFEEYDYSLASAIAMIMGVGAARHRRRRARPARRLSIAARSAEARDERRRIIGAAPLARRPSLVAAMIVLIAFFVVNVFGVIDPRSSSTRSRRAGSARGFPPAGRRAGTPRPGTSSSWTTVLLVTFEIVFVVVALSIADRRSRGLRARPPRLPRQAGWCMLLFLLPLLVPPITYGIPLATVLYQARLGRHDRRRHPRQPRADGAVRRSW